MQLSPIQCTYSNIFIRFFKFFPANTNIYQNSYRVIRRAVWLTPGCPARFSCHCEAPPLFGTKCLMSLQCGVLSGRLPRYARNDIVLRTEGKRMMSIAKTDKVFVWFILCHSEELLCNDVRISRKGYLVINPRKILLYLRGEKGANKQKSERYRPR